MSRILWISNAPWAGSGYGAQSAMFARRLRELGHDVAFLANFGLADQMFEWQGFAVYGADMDHGNRALETIAGVHEADLVVFLCDAWVLHPEKWYPQLEPDAELPVKVAVWAPVDHYPIPPAVFAVLDHDRVSPIAMSQFGSRMMRDVELEHAYVPHGVDLEVFKPRPEQRDEVRDQLGIPRDAFLAGMVARNNGSPQLPRKGFPQAFLAFARLAHAHPDAWLYVHTEAIPPGTGINLERLAVMAGVPLERLRFTSKEAFHVGTPDAFVAELYQTFDVLLHPAMGEGFGIPIVEAQACGVPVIVSRHSAMVELCGSGWLANVQPHWDALSDAWFGDPLIAHVGDCLEEAYQRRGELELRTAAVEFARQYDANAVTLDYWVPTLEALGCPSNLERVGLPEVESRQVRRARERREAKTRA